MSALQIKNLGVLEGSLLVFCGAYSNLEALETLIAIADHAGISDKNRLFLGDAVAYCADADRVVDRLIAYDYPAIAGNCERQLAQDAPDCGCGFETGSTCSLLSRAWYAYARQRISPHHRAWMASLPDWICFEHAQKRYVMIHGGADDLSRFIWSNAPKAVLQRQIDLIRDQIGAVDVVLCGHSGIYFKRNLAGVDWINCGVIGMPANNGQNQTQYVLIDAQGQANLQRLDYDYEITQQKMHDCGLVQGYDLCLQTGVWPSQESLPTELRLRA